MGSLFERNVEGMTACLSRTVIGIAGCGGIGSNVAAALVRAGAGGLLIADFDTVEISNLNRQYFFLEDLGLKKSDALKNRLLMINPDCSIFSYSKKLEREDIKDIFGNADLLIEAFDDAESKRWLIEEWACSFPAKPVVSGNGLSGYGKFENIGIKKAGNIYFCGDGVSSMEEGLCSARVAIVANIQANLAIEIMMNKTRER
ncbi:MAG: sulfur carrier protein ThiS adenylyltransferase ThiF [Candidatus Delongbacteria bacterium]